MVKRVHDDDTILKTLEDCGGIRAEAARRLNISTRGLFNRLDRMRSAGKDVPDSDYQGRVTGTSTLVDGDGNVKLQWIKEAADIDRSKAAIRAAAEELAGKITRIPASPAPKKANADLLTLYTLTDAHVGMRAWGRETGADWDLDIAERVLTQCFTQLIRSSPPSATCIVNQLGDFMHIDSLVPATPTSHNILDVDSRFQKLVAMAVRILRRIVTAALAKHDRVFVYMHEGNHDPASSVWLRVLFAAVYEDEPRVTVDDSPAPYIAFQHGRVMLGFHHGHLSKKQSLPLLFAAKYREEWGTASHAYIHVGHLHHVDEREHPGCTIIQHPTLAAPDAYSSRGGWLSKRQATAITYHSDFGEYARTTVVPEMVE